MSRAVTVFVNERPVAVAAGSEAAAAVARCDAALAAALREGRAHLTDGRGIRLDPAAPLAAGAIVRVVVTARRRPTDAGAPPDR